MKLFVSPGVTKSTASGLALLFALSPSSAIAESQLPAPSPSPAERRWEGAERTITRLLETLEREAQGPTALAQLHSVWNLNRLLEQDPAVLASLERLARRKLPALTKDHVRYLHALARLRTGKLQSAQRQLSRLGFPQEVLLVGPFDNTTGAGHDTAYAPERPEPGESFAGKTRRVRWRTVALDSPNGALNLSSIVHPSNEATVYVAFVIESAKRRRAVLRTGSNDQLKIFLNGALAQAIDTRRGAALDQDATPLDLPQGKSLVLIKSSWAGDEGRLFVRLTGPSGGAIPGIKLLAPPQTAKFSQRTYRRPRWRFERPQDRLERALRSARGAKRADLLALRADLFEILSLYDTRKLPPPPQRDLREAIKLAPYDPLLRFFFAHRVAPQDPNLAREQLEAALLADPGFAPALLELGQLALSAQRLLQARGLFERALKTDPGFLPAHVARAALGFDELGEDALAALRLSKTPGLDRSPLGLLELSRIRRALGDTRGALEAARASLALDQSQTMARHIALNLTAESGDIDGALKLLEGGLARAPHAMRLWARKAKLLAGAGRKSEALAVARELERRFIDHPGAAKLYADLLLWWGDLNTAQAKLERALMLEPHQPMLRKRLRTLTGARAAERATVDPMSLLGAKVLQEEKRWGAIYLAEHSIHRLYESGKSTRFKQLVLRLHNPRLKDPLRFHRVPYSPSRETVELIAAERIRPSGEVIRASRITDEGPTGKVSGMYLDQRYKLVAFDDLAQGDLVHLHYRIDSLGQNIFGGFFGDIEGLQGPLPKRDVLYEITSPKDRPLYPSGVRVPAPKRIEGQKTVTLRWRYDQIEALEREPHAPPYPERGMLISVSTYKNWNELGAWYARLFSEQLELDESARTAGRKVVQGADSEEEKIKRLYNYVVKNTRYVGIELGIHGWKPFKASEVHRRKYGDCKDKSTLLAALLRDNGIDATITLVRTADRGTLPKDHPTMWAFNHAITYVPSKKLFLDPTAEFSGSTELPHLDQGAMALIVESDGDTRLTELPLSAANQNLNSSSYTATLNKKGALVLEGTERFFGARAASLRQEYEVAERRKMLLERQLGQLFEGVQVERLRFSDLADLEAPVEYRYAATVERYGQLEPERLTIPVTLFQHQVSGAYTTLAERKLDLYISHPWSTRNVIRYRLPKGAKIEELPKGVSIDSEHIALVQKIRRVEGGFQTDDQVTLKSRVIPAKAYAKFRQACLAIDRALARKVIISW